MSGPLSHVRAVDITATLSGAYTARLLADMGAHVARPADARWLYAHLQGGRAVPDWDPGLHHVLNAGKDTSGSGNNPDVDGLLNLLEGVHLLVEDVGLLSADATRLTWDALHARHPNLTVVSMSTFGSTGPYADRTPSDLAVWALSGMAWTTPGLPDTPSDLPGEPPLAPTGVSLPSIIAGAVGTVATLATTYAGRGATVTGTHVEVSELEAVTALNYHPINQREYLGRVWDRGPTSLARQPNCYLPCKDGWLVLVAMGPRHWTQLSDAMGNPDWAATEDFSDGSLRGANWDVLSVLLTNWTMERTGREITEDLQARGLPVYWAATLEEVVTSDHVEARRFLGHVTDSEGHDVPFPGVPFVLSNHPRDGSAGDTSGDEPVASVNGRADTGAAPTPQRPLTGIRVVDFGQYIAVPFAAKWLAALGADVIQIESRENPADFRNSPPFANEQPGLNRAGAYNVLNAGKRSLTVNLRTDQGRALARRLAAEADVVLENYSTGLMENWDLGYDTLSATNPRLIYTSVAAFGRTGPLAQYSGLHSIINAFSGVADVTGYAGGHPRLLGSYYPDVVTATYATMGTLLALHDRHTSGKGQHVDVAMTECLMTLLPEPILARATGSYTPIRDGSHHPLHAPHNIYPSAGDDQWVAIAVRSESECVALCGVIGQSLAADRRFATVAGRKEHEDALDDVIATWTRARTKHEATAALVAAGVSAAPVLNPLEVAENPHLVERGFIGEIDHPEVGPRRTAMVPWRVDSAYAGEQRRAPLVNEYMPEILTGLLGIAPETIEELEREGALR